MIPLVCALNFGYSNPADRGVTLFHDSQGGFSNRLGEAADTGAVKEVADLGGRPRSLEFGE